jgi:hypothetical protein
MIVATRRSRSGGHAWNIVTPDEWCGIVSVMRDPGVGLRGVRNRFLWIAALMLLSAPSVVACGADPTRRGNETGRDSGDQIRDLVGRGAGTGTPK